MNENIVFGLSWNQMEEKVKEAESWRSITQKGKEKTTTGAEIEKEAIKNKRANKKKNVWNIHRIGQIIFKQFACVRLFSNVLGT